VPRLAAGSAPLPWLVAWRYLRGGGSRLLSGTARAALLATAIGVMAMVIAMALMTGYREDLQRKLIGGNAAIVAYPLGPDAPPVDAARRAALQALPGVEGVSAVAYGQGTIASAAQPAGIDVTLRGVDPGEAIAGGPPLPARQGEAELEPVVLGADLARRLGVRPGETLRLAALGLPDGRPRFAFRSLRFAGSFSTGFSEFDRAWAVLRRAEVAALAGAGSGAELYELRLQDPAAAPELARRVERVLGADYLVSDWQQLNAELFTALRVQQIALFLVLGLIVVVSTFNVASTLVVLVRERMREIGVLAALGLKPAGIRAVFLLYGGCLGFAGTLLGVAAGWGIAWTLNTFRLIRFDPEVAAIYFISSVPFRVDAPDLAAVVGFALAVNLAACVAPAWRAARVDPSAALRYE